jgi:hypothetical protein
MNYPVFLNHQESIFFLDKTDFVTPALLGTCTNAYAITMPGEGNEQKKQRPLRLIHLETLETYPKALTRETFLKSGVGRAWLDEHLTISP